jgi:hypothetical protein
MILDLSRKTVLEFCNEGPLKNCRHDFQQFTKETGRVVNPLSALMKISLFRCSIWIGNHRDIDFFTWLE